MGATRSAAISAAAVPVSFLAANALSYALLLVAAHRMAPSAYGVLSSLLGLLLISTIPMLALQTVTARRIASDGASPGITRGTAQVAALSTAGLCLAAPALSAFLHLDDVVGIFLVALTIPATAVVGAASGIAQGRRDFRPLAALILAGTGSRSLGGLVGLLVGGSPDATVGGVLIGTAAAALAVGSRGRDAQLLRQSLATRDHTGILAETLHAGHAHGTFLLLTSLDVLLARHVLSGHAAGVYAVGSVVTRAALWLPQSVVLLLFASLAEAGHHKLAARRASLTVIASGVVMVTGTAVLGSVVVSVVGGRKYHQLDTTIWLYALLGALLAIVQLSVMAGLAQRNRRRASVLWATIAADLAAVLLTGDDATPTRLVATLLIVTAVAAAVALWLTLREADPSAGQAGGVNAGSSPAPNREATTPFGLRRADPY